jgi:hypothetical protein
MKYILVIGYVSKLDLLHKALDSIPTFRANTIVVDNSERRTLRGDASVAAKAQVYEPPVPLTVSQLFNYLFTRGIRENCDIVMFMHEDGEALPGVPDQLLATIDTWNRTGRRWGAAFANYDTLAAYNMQAVKDTGFWDTNIHSYCADIDYYRRMRLAGYETIETYLPVHHHANITTKSNPYFKQVVDVIHPLAAQYYAAKWGGPMGEEKFTSPFNR